MRIENAEESLGDLGEFVVDFEMNAGGQEGEGFQQTLYMRVVALIGFEDESTGDFWVFLAEFGA
jgi:hypothetical protein